MNQTTFFDLTPEPTQYDNMPLAAPVQATARISDPQSSHDAAERMNKGKAKRHRERVVDLVWSHPGNTSKGLVAFTDAQDKEDGIDRHEIARRLSEAEAAGDVYRVDQAGSDLRWFPGTRTEAKK